VRSENWWKTFAIFLGFFLLLGAGLTELYLNAPWVTGGESVSGRWAFLRIFRWFLLAGPFVAAAAASVVEGAASLPGVAYMGRDGKPEPVLELSLIRSHLKREEWDQARAVLDQQWAAHPGREELLREYERYFEALGAPSAAAEFFESQTGVLKGDARAYAYLRLAEMNADVLRRPDAARHWCRRLVAEFPSSPLAPEARAMLDGLGPGPGS
jgi:tetratricopeptide (TPR) repeat protein